MPKAKEKRVETVITKPGEVTFYPGEYIECGPRGGEIEGARRITLKTMGILPKTSVPGRSWLHYHVIK